MEMSFEQFLQWLIYGGGSVMAVSWILERIAAFKELASNVKQIVTFVLTALLSIGAYMLVQFAPDFIAMASPYFSIIAVVFSMVFLKDAFHRATKLN